MPNIGKRTIHTRHDTVFAQIHSNISKEIRVKLDKEHWYYYVSKTVETSREVKVTTSRSTVQTDRTIPNNKTVIIIRDNDKGTCVPIDVAISLFVQHRYTHIQCSVVLYKIPLHVSGWLAHHQEVEDR